jgi:hypothetical protein
MLPEAQMARILDSVMRQYCSAGVPSSATFSAAPESITPWMILAPLGFLGGVGVIDWAMIVGLGNVVGVAMLDGGWGWCDPAGAKYDVRAPSRVRLWLS